MDQQRQRERERGGEMEIGRERERESADAQMRGWASTRFCCPCCSTLFTCMSYMTVRDSLRVAQAQLRKNTACSDENGATAATAAAPAIGTAPGKTVLSCGNDAIVWCCSTVIKDVYF